MEGVFLKVDRRGRLLERRLSIDSDKQLLCYCRFRKKFTLKRTSCYPIASISDVRKNWDSQKFKKIEEQERQKWLNESINEESRIREENSFSVIFNNQKSLDLIAPDRNTRDQWVQQLKGYLFSAKNNQKNEATRTFLLKSFKEVDTDSDNCIDFIQAYSILNKLGIPINKKIAQEIFEKSDIVSKVKGNEKIIDFDEFIIFYENLTRRADIEEVFTKYAKDQDMLGPEELQRFFFTEQYISYDLADCKRFIEKYQSSWLSKNLLDNSMRLDETHILEHYMNVKGFEAMLLSEDFDLFDRQKLETRHDMHKPLNHYYIKSSHNTYLLAGQLVGDSSVEGYIEALRRGYRCIELDIWDGDEEDGPIVYHGYTMVSKLLLRNVLDTISDHAFDTTPYPLILSLDVNCSEEQQSAAAALLVAILGDQLYKRPIFSDEKSLPSPEQLKGKILVKARSKTDEDETISSSSSGSSIDEKMNETRKYITERRYSTAIPVNTNNLTRRMTKSTLISSLGDLAIYCKARKFHSLKDTMKWRFNEMFSMNEDESASLAQFETEDYIKCTSRTLCRIYPKGSRIDSSNYDPVIHWNVGCQMVALNVQTPGKNLMMNENKFRANGRCGYVLKPDFLINGEMEGANERKGLRLKTLEITIISGHCLPKNGNEGLVDPYVQVKVHGHHSDKQKLRTSVVKNNGFNPKWNETFVINIKHPELAFLSFKVKDENKKTRNAQLGSNIVPFSLVGQGYRHLRLVDNQGKKIDDCMLFMRIALFHS
ncbi:1-phosphatidylinositol 4,5-bisphosphate phosphodiesterase zeta-1-like [Brevipalpus obovatus]|uniref:1-phosphatidylinositol 4,5-bisphosphate phosphodiesterase zeta-1-like n=1 Tax=Brevipalpus obovatus TaxID=246614 RepID=UPI003D9EB804